MSILYINTGTNPNAGDGDSIRLAFTKINRNFSEVEDRILNVEASTTSTLVAGTYTFTLSTTGTVTLNGNLFGGESSDRLISSDTTKTFVLDDNGVLTLRGYGTYTAFVSEIAGGTEGAPTAIASGTVIAALTAGGYDGNQWITERNTSVAWLEFSAAENWNSTDLTATNVGTNVSLNVHPPGIHLSTDTHQTILSTAWGFPTRNSPPLLTINFGNADETSAPLINSQNLVTYKGVGSTNLHYHHTRPTFFGVTSGSSQFTGNIQGNVLTVDELDFGNIYKISIGSTLLNITGSGVITGTQIISYGTGIGGTGTYIVDISQSVSTSTLVLVTADNFGINGTNVITIDTARRSNIVGKRFALKQNDDIGRLVVKGQVYDNSSNLGRNVGSIYWDAREDFTNTQTGSRFYLLTSDIGTNNNSHRLLLDNQGNQYRSALHVFNGAGDFRSTATITSAGPNSGLEPAVAIALDETNNQPCNLIINTNNGEGPGGEIVLHTGADQGLTLRANTNQDVITITTASFVVYATTASLNDLNVSGLITLGEFQGYDNLSIIKNDPDILNFTLRNLHVDSATEINIVDNYSGGLTIVHQNSTAASGDFAAGENFIYGESVNDTINIGRNQDLKFFANSTWTNWSSATPVVEISKDDGSVTVNKDIYSGNIIPNADKAYDLGSTSSQWRSLYVSTNTIYIGGVPLSLDSSTSLTINGNPVVTYNSTSGNFSAGGASVQGSGVYESNIPPDNTNLLWYDTVSGRLYIYYDSSWVDASPGAIGPAGPQGPRGPSGVNGPQGPSGPSGVNGAQGPSGVNGPQGPSGAAGSNGAQGPQGPSGAAGSNGAQGPQGPSGAAGSNGAQGPQGPSGVAGPTGPMGLFTATGNIIGTLTNVTLVAGSYSYTFDNTGTFTMPADGDIIMTGTNSILSVSGTTLLGGYAQVGGYYSTLGVKYPGGGVQHGMTLQPTTDNTTAINFLNAAGTNIGAITQTTSTVTFTGDGSGLTNLPGVTTRTTGTWTVPVGTNTYSITVPQNGAYQIWVRGNIPNGIIAYNATAVVTNTNVPVVGAQYAWVYNGGGTPIDFTSIPNQFIGTANTIVRSSTAPSATTNRFDFGINNSSGSSQTVYWGYVAL